MPDSSPPTRRLATVALAIVLALPLAGCAGDTPAPAPSPEPTTLAGNETIPPGEFLEANLEMNESAELTYRWSTAPETVVDFDVHSHDGRQVEYHERTSDTAGEGSFTAPEEGSFSLLWQNPAEEPVEVSFHVEGDFRVQSTVP